MNKIEQLTEGLNRAMCSTTFRVEVDTEDMVFGFRKTIKVRTKSIAKAQSQRAKTYRDIGKFISDTVRIVEVRWFNNDKMVKRLVASSM